MKLPTLASNRVTLLPIASSDLALYLSIYTDKAVMEKICPPLSKQQTTLLFNNALQRKDRDNNKRLAWTLVNDTSEKIGIIALSWDEESHDVASIGIVMLTQNHSKGFAVESMTTLISYAFDKLRLSNIKAQISDINIKSQQLVAKLGFQQLEGVTNEELFEYSLSQTDFLKATNS